MFNTVTVECQSNGSTCFPLNRMLSTKEIGLNPNNTPWQKSQIKS